MNSCGSCRLDLRLEHDAHRRRSCPTRRAPCRARTASGSSGSAGPARATSCLPSASDWSRARCPRGRRASTRRTEARCTAMRHWPRASSSTVQRARTRRLPRPAFVHRRGSSSAIEMMLAAAGKVRPRDERQQLVDRRSSDCGSSRPPRARPRQVVRRNVGGHADADAGCPVEQQHRQPRRQQLRLPERAVVVGRRSRRCPGRSRTSSSSAIGVSRHSV